MKTVTTHKANKNPPVVIDKKLDYLDKTNLFPEKVKKARQKISQIGLPKK